MSVLSAYHEAGKWKNRHESIFAVYSRGFPIHDALFRVGRVIYALGV